MWPFYPLGDCGRPTGYCHSDVHPSSIRRTTFQLSLVARVPVVFTLYCMVMVPSIRLIWDFVSRCWPSWIQCGRHSNCQKTYFIKFPQVLCPILTQITYHRILEVKDQLYELNVGHLEFKMADTETTKLHIIKKHI